MRQTAGLDAARSRCAAGLALVYRDENARQTRRTIWPIAVSYWNTVRVVVAWCELRKGFRSFRTDRVEEAEFLSQHYPVARARLTGQWRKELAVSIGRGNSEKRKAAQQKRM